jgi:hypothetical protein
VPSIRPSSSPVRAKWPRWLVASVRSNPSSVTSRGIAITPALLISRSRLGQAARICPAASRTEASDARSRCTTSTLAPAAADRIRSAARSVLPRSRPASTTAAPCPASTSAVSSPRPPLAPVTTAVRPDWSGTSAAVHRPRRSAIAASERYLSVYQILIDTKIQRRSAPSTPRRPGHPSTTRHLHNPRPTHERASQVFTCSSHFVSLFRPFWAYRSREDLGWGPGYRGARCPGGRYGTMRPRS